MRKGQRSLRARSLLLVAIAAATIGTTPSALSAPLDSGGGGSVGISAITEGSVSMTVRCSLLSAQIRHLGDGQCR
jgi:hypothetical protein